MDVSAPSPHAPLFLWPRPTEFARHVLGWADANSTEVNPQTPHPVVLEMPEVSLTQLGGTMRLGKRRTIFVKKDCVISTWGMSSLGGGGCHY